MKASTPDVLANAIAMINDMKTASDASHDELDILKAILSQFKGLSPRSIELPKKYLDHIEQFAE